jgi:hypothetical protein
VTAGGTDTTPGATDASGAPAGASATWADLEAAEPELAARGQALLTARGWGSGLLATVRDGVPPRIHPMSVAIVEGHLLTVVLGGSAKARDVTADGRYALHAHQDAGKPDEFQVRGHARVVDAGDFRDRVVAHWHFEVGDEDLVVELGIEHALLGERPDAGAWPPVYRSWHAPGG